MQSKVLFVGGGNMAASLIGGLLADGHNPEALHVIEPDERRRQWMQERFNISFHASQDELETAGIKAVDLLVLAVKPQTMAQVAAQWRDYIQAHEPVVISIAAGIRTTDLSRWLEGYDNLVRAMPNTPALIQTGATGLFACPGVDGEGRANAEAVLRAAGLTLWVDAEDLLDAITAVSGSGPAYFFRFMEALQAAGTGLGLEEHSARLLTLQTALGAARMALESDDSLAELRERVTSPGGTTERALAQFEQDDLGGAVERAVVAAALRARELADELGAGEPDEQA